MSKYDIKKMSENSATLIRMQNVQTDYRQKETKYMTHGCTTEVGQTIYRVALNTSLEYMLVSDCCSYIFVSGMSIDV